MYSVAKLASISQIPDWLYELTFHPLNDCASSSLINGERGVAFSVVGGRWSGVRVGGRRSGVDGRGSGVGGRWSGVGSQWSLIYKLV